MSAIINSDKKFDIQLETAKERELELARLLSDGTVRIELKSETYLWRRTGNLCIEYRNRGQLSGISTTEADQWVHELYDDDDRLIVRMMFPVDRLRELCRKAFKRGRYRTNVGDDHASDVVLLSLKDLIG